MGWLDWSTRSGPVILDLVPLRLMDNIESGGARKVRMRVKVQISRYSNSRISTDKMRGQFSPRSDSETVDVFFK